MVSWPYTRLGGGCALIQVGRLKSRGCVFYSGVRRYSGVRLLFRGGGLVNVLGINEGTIFVFTSGPQIDLWTELRVVKKTHFGGGSGPQNRV